MVSTHVGPQYLGKIKYSMTEWDAGSPSGYNRDITYVSALFKAQYILEMCKYGGKFNPWARINTIVVMQVSVGLRVSEMVCLSDTELLFRQGYGNNYIDQLCQSIRSRDDAVI
jgi:hypothetical protein